MSALTTKRSRSGKQTAFRFIELTLAAGYKGFHNGVACLTSGGQVVPASSTPGLSPIGLFFTNPADCVDATVAAQTVTVDLLVERLGDWFANATNTDAVAVTDIGKMAYLLDDQTVTITASGRSPAGRIWGVSAAKGVLIEARSVGTKSFLSQPTLPAFAANDCAPAALEHDAVYAIPAFTANSTVTLPAAAQDGTRVHFVNDGTSAFTLTYRDATGTVSLNTATTASKRHGVTAVKKDGKWFLVGLSVAP